MKLTGNISVNINTSAGIFDLRPATTTPDKVIKPAILNKSIQSGYTMSLGSD